MYEAGALFFHPAPPHIVPLSTTSQLQHAQKVTGLHGLREGTKAGQLCVTLLDVDCCHPGSRSIGNADTLSTQLRDHLNHQYN